jgi:hypothetical protein
MDNKQLQYSAMVALAFVILSHPAVYKITDKYSRMFLKVPLANMGCPNNYGLIVHGLVAGGLVYYLLSKHIILTSA